MSFPQTLAPRKLAKVLSTSLLLQLLTNGRTAVLTSRQCHQKLVSPVAYTLKLGQFSDFSRDLENLSLNLSPTRRETLNLPPSRVGKGARGLGFSSAFPHDVKSQGQFYR